MALAPATHLLTPAFNALEKLPQAQDGSDYSFPDPKGTPGSLCTDDDDNFDGYRYHEQIAHCKRNVPKSVKLKIAKKYGIKEEDFSDYEFDHLIPLSVGGSDDITNIWPQPLDEAKEKDKVEQSAYLQLSKGDITQKQAIQMMWDWFEEEYQLHNAPLAQHALAP